jgi:hypothetical protein
MPDIVFVFGCQRSGTTMLLDIFDKDFHALVYRDISVLTSEDGPAGLRLNSLDSVHAQFAACRARLAVAKPIVESQRAVQILDRFPHSRGLWIYRDFRDVASSDLRLFGIRNGINNLRPIVEGTPDNWRSEDVSAAVRETIRGFFALDMNPYDAAALFWYARNAIFFEQNLHQHERVAMLEYEAFVQEPDEGMRRIYSWIGRPFPGERLTSDVYRSSVGRSRDLGLSEPVADLCESLLERLKRVSPDPL